MANTSPEFKCIGCGLARPLFVLDRHGQCKFANHTEKRLCYRVKSNNGLRLSTEDECQDEDCDAQHHTTEPCIVVDRRARLPRHGKTKSKVEAA